MMRRAFLAAAVLAGTAAARAAAPQPVRVYAAVTLSAALDAVAAGWQEKSGLRALLVYGASPALAKQIENGAPADIFISADREWMDYVAGCGLIRPESRFDLLSNRLVLIARSGSALRATIAPGFPLAALLGEGRLAMCNPLHHPAGRYARASLETLGVWASVAGKVAIAENVQAAVTMVGRGEVPLAIVFATDAAGDPRVRTIATFPDASHPPIVYPAALTKTSAAEAASFLAYLKSPSARAVFERLGYRVLD